MSHNPVIFVQRMTRNDAPEISPCHYFSTHFYSKLCKEGPEGVQKWTERKGIDIFQKRLIFVPVNKTMHWSLAVIVNPGAIDDHCDLMDKYGCSLNENVLASVGDHPCPVILFFDSLKCHPRSSVAKTLRNWLNAEWRRKMGGRIDRREDPFKPNTMKVITPGGEFVLVALFFILFHFLTLSLRQRPRRKMYTIVVFSRVAMLWRSQCSRTESSLTPN